MKAVEEAYEKQPKKIKSIFNRECMTELFISMLQEFAVDYNKIGFCETPCPFVGKSGKMD